MSDLISLKDVLHELDLCDYGLKDWQKWKLKTMVRDIPFAQLEQRWIPISEKRPEVGKDVLVSVDTAESGNCWVTIAYMCHDFTDDEYWFQNDDMRFDIDEVFAWMYPPKPYNAESEE